MPPPPPHPPILNPQKSLLLTLTDFLTVAVHTILYTRSLYPPATFLTTRRYNTPVHQNRHPLVCQWINNAISHVHKVLETNSVRRVVFVVFNGEGRVLERFVFDVERFPVVERGSAWVEFEEREEGKGKEREGEVGGGKKRAWNVVDIEEQLRATIQKLDFEASRKAPLPEGCTYTLVVELRDTPAALPPVGHPQPWIPSEPSLQTGEKGGSQTIGTDLGGVKSTPVRLVESGEFVLETWIEEGEAKFAAASSQSEAESSLGSGG